MDPRDVAAVAVAVLTEEGHDTTTYTLTGPQAISVADQAAVLGDVLGREIAVRPVPVPDAAWATGVAWARDGHNAVVTDDLPRVLGRPAGTFRAWVEAHRPAFG